MVEAAIITFFFGSWALLAYLGRKRKMSRAISFGGSFIISCLLVVFVASVKGKQEANTKHGRAQVAQPKPLSRIIFDIPSLVGKSIDEIRKTLGKPKDQEIEPTGLQMKMGVNEWDNLFTNDGKELLVTFNPRTRRVIDFFLEGQDKTILMQRGNLVEGTRAYRIEPVHEIREPSKISGIKIIPGRGTK